MLSRMSYDEPTTHQLKINSPLDGWLSSKQDDNDRAVLKLEFAAEGGVSPTPLIVVVDDEPVIAVTIAEILSRNGLPAVWFTDPRRALCFIASAAIGLLMSDITMPHLDGFALAHGTHMLQPSCALFLFSGLAGEKSMQDRAAASGLPIHMAAKPLCPRHMVYTVRSLIGTPLPSGRSNQDSGTNHRTV